MLEEVDAKVGTSKPALADRSIGEEPTLPGL